MPGYYLRFDPDAGIGILDINCTKNHGAFKWSSLIDALFQGINLEKHSVIVFLIPFF